MPISRELALKILKYLVDNPLFYFPFFVVCKEYTPEDEDFVELDPNVDYETIRDFDEYQTFQLWENLQDLRAETIELMSKGFIEKIFGDSIENELEALAKEYRTKWNVDLCDSTDIEEFGQNEYFGGKKEGFEESLEIVRKYLQKLQ
jgi:hypothetical protein